jgi:transmembrane sensor
MKPKSKGGGKVAEEAAFWVVELTEKPNRQTRARFRVWARGSTRHWEQFLVAASLYRAFHGFDRQRSIDVVHLLRETQATVLRWKSCDQNLSSSECNNQIASENPRRGAMHWQWAKSAAAVLVLTVAVPLIGQAVNLPTHREYTTPSGEELHIPLEDGSVVHLNERSALAVTRTPHAHTVLLRRGEAFFDVHHAAGHRLWVLLDNAVVEDIGTQFDVRRSEEGDVTVSVLQGSVKVGGGSSDTLLFSPSFVVAGQEVRIRGAGGQAQLQLQHRSLADLESQRAWVLGWLTFNGEPLEAVVRTLNARHRRQVVIADPSIAQLPVGGRFLAGDLDGLVKTLTQALPVRVLPSRGVSDSNLIRLARAPKSSGSSSSPHTPDQPRN